VDVKTLIDVAAVSVRLGLPEWATYDLARRGQLPSVKIGRRVRFDPDAVERFIESGGNARKVVEMAK
jgi:excisionase family DNA binding protein